MARIPISYKSSSNKNYRKQCYDKDICIDFRRKYGPQSFPVCPILREVVNRQKLYSMAEITETNCPTLDSITRILAVSGALIRLEPNVPTVVWCAHRENFLKDWIDPIRDDLSTLPQRLEKNFPDTSKKCIELVAELKLAELRYTFHCNGRVYLFPPDPEYGNWATFLDWRQREIEAAGHKDFSETIEMNRLTCNYPAEAIKVMNKIIETLTPVARILVETLPSKENNHEVAYEKSAESWGWNLYEKTLKVIVESLLEIMTKGNPFC